MSGELLRILRSVQGLQVVQRQVAVAADRLPEVNISCLLEANRLADIAPLMWPELADRPVFMAQASMLAVMEAHPAKTVPDLLSTVTGLFTADIAKQATSNAGNIDRAVWWLKLGLVGRDEWTMMVLGWDVRVNQARMIWGRPDDMAALRLLAPQTPPS